MLNLKVADNLQTSTIFISGQTSTIFISGQVGTVLMN